MHIMDAFAMDLVHRSQDPYTQLYQGLTEVREIFHREGRLNDANAKLDETVKLLAVHYSYFYGQLEPKLYQKLCHFTTFTCHDLQTAFKTTIQRPPFVNHAGAPIFSDHDRIAFENGEENIAFELFNTLRVSVASAFDVERPFDFLNEAFGHHVRDNFRNHTEDAQYMTPPEVVHFMAEMAMAFVKENQRIARRDNFTMMDPSCGVGSFLNMWRWEFEKTFSNNERPTHLTLIGQDKVERMTKLASLNLILAGYDHPHIYNGNSLNDGSPISKWDGQVDLILTNPPFGARFPIEQIRQKGRQSTPSFASGKISATNIDSELLFLDRYLSLLREGGLCLAVVPDGVISAKGVAAYFRQKLADLAAVRAVVELPPVTFSQAGTRTKTAVLMIEKVSGGGNRKDDVFFAEAHDLGFDVTKRKGVPIKKVKGRNELPDILEMYRRGSLGSENLSTGNMLAKWCYICPASVSSWTPRQFAFDAESVKAGLGFQNASVTPLSEVVERPVKRKARTWSEGCLFISVLHIVGEAMLDIPGVHGYEPVTPGLPVYPGEVLISRINPRIPRVLVVPDLGYEMLCSSEFEILRPKYCSAYELAFLLLSEPVQSQIRSLTAGTSASHARVKSNRLYEIELPRPTGQEKTRFLQLIEEYKRHCESAISSLERVYEIRKEGLGA